MSPEHLVIACLAIPAIAAAVIPLCGRYPNLREAVTLTAAGLLLLSVLGVAQAVIGGGRPVVNLIDIIPATGTSPAIGLSFAVEPLGMLFALVASGLWIVNSIYSIGYMRGNDEPRQTPFYMCFAIALSSTIGIAFSANLFTLFLFYELLTLSTYPLVTHKGDDAAKRGGRIYLMILIGTSMVLLLPAIMWTYVLAGTMDFTVGGILAGKVEGPTVAILLALYAFGIGKAGLMPFHAWLPNAMVAPTPVSALLHAVAVVKAGVFSVMKIVIYIFGIDFLASSGEGEWLVYVAAVTIVLASLIALTKDNLKARLAYSTVSQLGYVVLGAALANTLAMQGGSMHIAMHAVGKITLFFCAGAIYTAAHKTEVSELSGLGRAMPVTFFAFLVGAVSIIGLPPFGGVWSKWYLVLGALEAKQLLMVAVLMLSSLLNIAYLLPIPIKAFFGKPADGKEVTAIKEAPLPCLIALCATATGCLLLFLFPNPLYDLIQMIEPR